MHQIKCLLAIFIILRSSTRSIYLKQSDSFRFKKIFLMKSSSNKIWIDFNHQIPGLKIMLFLAATKVNMRLGYISERKSLALFIIGIHQKRFQNKTNKTTIAMMIASNQMLVVDLNHLRSSTRTIYLKQSDSFLQINTLK